MKFTDNTTLLGLRSDNEETHRREEVQHLLRWGSDNNLVLNITITKEMNVDCRRSWKTSHPPLHINYEKVESVNDIKFLGINRKKISL